MPKKCPRSLSNAIDISPYNRVNNTHGECTERAKAGCEILFKFDVGIVGNVKIMYVLYFVEFQWLYIYQRDREPYIA